MPRCPRCGGTRATEIAPGYYECDSIVEDDRCTHRYQGGPQRIGELCRCGTLAVGRCTRCSAWVCGDHSFLREESRTCTWCADKDRAEAERTEREAAADWWRRIKEVPMRQLIDEFLAAMADAANPGTMRIRYCTYARPRGLLPAIVRHKTYPARAWPIGGHVETYLALDGSLVTLKHVRTVVLHGVHQGARLGETQIQKAIIYRPGDRDRIIESWARRERLDFFVSLGNTMHREDVEFTGHLSLLRVPPLTNNSG